MSEINIFAAIAASFALVSSDAFADSSQVRKCYRDGKTLYQDAPCATTHVALPYADAAATSVAARPPVPRERRVGVAQVDAPAAPGVADIAEQWRRGALAPGMSDTVVLNRPKWGRPKAVARSRAPDGYREVWTYAADANGANRVLTFLNGRLVEIRFDEPPPATTHAFAGDPRLLRASVPFTSERTVVRVGATDSSIPHGASIAISRASEPAVSVAPMEAPARIAHAKAEPGSPRGLGLAPEATGERSSADAAPSRESLPTSVIAVPDTAGSSSSEHETSSSFATSGVAAISE